MAIHGSVGMVVIFSWIHLDHVRFWECDSEASNHVLTRVTIVAKNINIEIEACDSMPFSVEFKYMVYLIALLNTSKTHSTQVKLKLN